MDEQSAEKITETTRKMTGSGSEAAREFMNLAVTAQERNTRLAQSWVENVVEAFNAQAETNRALTRSMESYTKVVEKALKSQEETNRALTESLNAYRTIVDNANQAQERNMKFAQDWMETVVATLRDQAEAQQRMMVDFPREQMESFQSLARDSMKAYMDLLSAPFAYYREGVRAVTSAALPIKNYDDLNVDEISKKLDSLNPAEIATLKTYELQTKNRETLIEQYDRRLGLKSGS
jgi:hypothetical protein